MYFAFSFVFSLRVNQNSKPKNIKVKDVEAIKCS